MIDLAAERACLASVIQYGSDAYIEMSDIIKGNYFDDNINSTIWNIIEHTFHKNPNTKFDYGTFRSSAQELSLSEFIKDKEINNYLKSLKTLHVEKTNIRNHAIKVLKCSVIRDLQSKVIGQSQDNVDRLNGSESMEEILNSVEQPVFDYSLNLSNYDDNPKIISDITRECVDNYLNNPVDIIGISTSYPILDQLTGGGLRRGSVWVIAARPKCGKTSLASNISLHVSGKLKIPTLILDTEMKPEDQIPRMLATIAGVKISDVETGKFGKHQFDKSKVMKAVDELEKYNLYYKSINGFEFDSIIAYIKRWVMRYVGINKETGKTNDCLVVLDYLKMMNENGLNKLAEYQSFGFIMQKLTTISNQLDIPILTFVQENRDGDLSQSDRILWLGSTVLMFQKKTPEEISEDPIEAGNRKIIGRGIRFGPGIPDDDYLCLNFDTNTNRIYELGLRSQIIDNKKDNEINDTEESI